MVMPKPADPGYVPTLIQKRNGWTAARQRTFLVVLAETGSVREACAAAGVSSRSAYRLRLRPDATAFADAWDAALRQSAARRRAALPPRASVAAPSMRQMLAAIRHLNPHAFSEGTPAPAPAPDARAPIA